MKLAGDLKVLKINPRLGGLFKLQNASKLLIISTYSVNRTFRLAFMYGEF
jgi:hypothetical protein